LETKIVLTCFVAAMATIFCQPPLFCPCHKLGCHGNAWQNFATMVAWCPKQPCLRRLLHTTLPGTSGQDPVLAVGAVTS
jgi:hypothetical protein